jgi:hypothetical protein
MKKSLLLPLLVFAASTSQAASFHCFSKYYTANEIVINIDGEVVADNQIANLVVDDPSDGLKSQQNLVEADPTYKPRVYKGYNLYPVPNNQGSQYQHGVTLLLPANLSQVQGRFTGFVSDALADGEGSNGYFTLLCSMK